MSYFKQVFRVALLFLVALSPLGAKEDHNVEDQPYVLQEAIELANTGTLKQKANGFVYLDVSDEFIRSVLPLVEHEGLIRGRPTGKRSIGAHISVFVEGENISPDELGESFSFEVSELRSFTMHTRDGLKKLWVIAVDSPELEALREQYGLSPKLKGHEFHITLGKQIPCAPTGWEEVDTFSSFESSTEPTEGLQYSGDFIRVDNDEVINTAAKVDAVGRLKIKGNGFVYLDVEDAYIEEISQLLPVDGSFVPLSTGPKKMGAHVSVIHEDEMIGRGIWELAQAGEWFSFQVKELRYVDRKTSKGKQRLWLLAVESPALERLRKSYGLRSKLQGHDFHITLGHEMLETSAKSPSLDAVAPAA